MDATSIIYTGLPLTYISTTNGMNLKAILININTAINSMSPAPDYSSYNLGPYHGYSITQTDGTSHPTNTQNFAEGIAKIVCTDEYNLANFIGTTYANNQTTITTALNGLQTPGVTYSPYSITNTMTVTQTWNALFTGLSATITSIDPYTANWSTLSITPSHVVVTTWNNVISYLSALSTTVSGKQVQISTFDNTGNCLAGGATDSIYTTVGELITYTCALPTFNNGSITYGGVSAGTNLQSAVQNTITSTNYLLTNAVVAQGTGLTISAVGSTYQGKKLTIDTTYTQLYKVMVTGDTYSNADLLDQKVESADSSITLNVTGNKLNLQVTNPVDNKVKVNSSDSTADYLSTKIIATNNADWGLSITPVVTTDNSGLQLFVGINPQIFIPTFLNYISTSPDILSQYCLLSGQCGGGSCGVVTTLVVTLGGGGLQLNWTAVGGSTTNQIAQYRTIGDSNWITINFNPANPLSAGATTTVATVTNNTPYQVQVNSICPGGIGIGNIYEGIVYACQSTTHTIVTGVISVTQSPLPGISTIQYRLKNAGNTVVDSQTATGLVPQVSFAVQNSGTYHVEWRYGTTINGLTLYSDDASQLGAYCAVTGLVIP